MDQTANHIANPTTHHPSAYHIANLSSDHIAHPMADHPSADHIVDPLSNYISYLTVDPVIESMAKPKYPMRQT